MGSFIKLSNFVRIAPYLELFKQGLVVTLLLSFFTVASRPWECALLVLPQPT